jgi:hypothetical protein
LLFNNDGDDCFVLEGAKKVHVFLGENMVKYIEKIDEEISNFLKMQFFTKTQELDSNFT